MWIFTIFPEWTIHIIPIIGLIALILAFFLTFIPFVSTYKLPIKVIGILVLLLGLYLEGGLSNEKEWQSRIKDMEVRLAKAEAESSNKNVEINEKVVERTKVVREKGQDLIRYIDREIVKKEEIVKYIEHCPIPKELVDVHNAATELNKGDNKGK